MSRPTAELVASSGGDGRTLSPETLRQAVRALGISRDKVAQLEDFTKRLVDEESAGRGQYQVELLRMGTSLLQPESPPPSPVGPSHAASNTQNSKLNNTEPAPSAPPTTRDAQTQTDDVSFKEWLVKEFHTMRVCGLGYETLVIRDVPGGKPTLVVVGDSPLSALQASIEGAYDGDDDDEDDDEDDDDGPIWGDESLPIREAVPSTTEVHSCASPSQDAAR
ncbi:hypothetical protein B0I37DRAFT_86844 [Chaetomium sp. MPI-CAGE-AT-0009]|nr:hypothetical protein B0I37DRAFT_86844 [Chaetomium sp. MPI-CAGE-AT-0009]